MNFQTALRKAARKVLADKKPRASQHRLYNAAGLAGCVERRRSRQTGSLIAVFHCEQSGIDGGEYLDEKPNPWATVCETHGHIVGHANLANARAHAADPLGWCDTCREQKEGGETSK